MEYLSASATAAGRGSGKHAGAGLADSPEARLDVRNQFLNERISIGAVVSGVDVVRGRRRPAPSSWSRMNSGVPLVPGFRKSDFSAMSLVTVL